MRRELSADPSSRPTPSLQDVPVRPVPGPFPLAEETAFHLSEEG
jgi:hypothetical protein